MTQATVAVLLAGGLARRMGGGDKPLKILAGRSLFDRVAARVRPQVHAMALNANGDPARFAGWTGPIVPDTVGGNPGPLAGVLAGMRWARHVYPALPDLLSVPTDTPFLPPDLVSRLRAARLAADVPIACAVSGGRAHPVIALWPVALADALEAALHGGARRIGEWMRQFGVAEAVFDTADGDPFFNVNTVAELAEAEAMLVAD